MASEVSDLNSWLEKLKQAKSMDDIFKIVDQFRIGDWTDQERSSVSRLYIRLLEKLQKDTLTAAAAAKKTTPKAGTIEEDDELSAPGEDGPVWYEKI